MAAKANSKIRLYVETGLTAGAEVALTADQAHYLRTVMRRQQGDVILLFNGQDGEWEAEIADLARKAGTARCLSQTRPQGQEPDIWLLFAPVKKARLDMIVEKATELGVAVLQPVITQYTDVERVKTERLTAQVHEAAEQCERLSLPEVKEPLPLAAILADWPRGRALIFADEAGGHPALGALREWGGSPAAVLVGPEGGFSPAEREVVRKLGSVVPVSLGPRILRAETAVIALLSLWMAACGDWR